jgi:AcrR family transcriptional regulator
MGDDKYQRAQKGHHENVANQSCPRRRGQRRSPQSQVHCGDQCDGGRQTDNGERAAPPAERIRRRLRLRIQLLPRRRQAVATTDLLQASGYTVLKSPQGFVIGRLDAKSEGIRGGIQAQPTLSKANRPIGVRILDVVHAGASGHTAHVIGVPTELNQIAAGAIGWDTGFSDGHSDPFLESRPTGINTQCLDKDKLYHSSHGVYTGKVPKLWDATIETHRRAVQNAAIDATAALVAENGLLSVTMSQIAQKAGVGRATLYKYFPDVEAILFAWHERQVSTHLEQLAKASDNADTPAKRLEAVLRAYAHIAHQSHGHRESQLAAVMHRGEHVARAQQHLHTMIRGLLAEAAEVGDVRTDSTPDELATYCLYALTAAGALRPKAAVDRLVDVTLTGLQPPRPATQPS